MKANKELIPPGLSYLADNIISKDNLFGASKEKGARWAKNLNLPKESETVFFAGCGYQYLSELESLLSLLRKIDKSAINTEMAISLASFQKKLGFDATNLYSRVAGRSSDTGARPLLDTVKVLSKLGLKFGYLAEREPCCGGLLYYAGRHKEFSRHAQEVSGHLKSSGVKQIISIVPSCTYTLRNLMTSAVGGDGLVVKHFCEVVAENLPSLELRFPEAVKVTYHDPCQMVRYLSLVDEPRRILRAIKGIEFVEPEGTSGEWVTCCGGGGGFEIVFPELSEICAVNRARELVATGAEIIVTQCPACIMQLKVGLSQLKIDNVKVLDLAQIVAMAMGVSGE
ncbi:MAG: (Fe-S)-binding protein [Chloroflexi bacterium]|nr:(Fe-S)-binding protein [Chloroflexota bacterium]